MCYRGGASEGQLPYIAREERQAFEEAFKELDVQYNPTFLLLGVTKDHTERFYGRGAGGVDNALPGTIVDKGAVSAEINEFFLQSHKALQVINTRLFNGCSARRSRFMNSVFAGNCSRNEVHSAPRERRKCLDG